jgi:hypothetical protein
MQQHQFALVLRQFEYGLLQRPLLLRRRQQVTRTR